MDCRVSSFSTVYLVGRLTDDLEVLSLDEDFFWDVEAKFIEWKELVSSMARSEVSLTGASSCGAAASSWDSDPLETETSLAAASFFTVSSGVSLVTSTVKTFRVFLRPVSSEPGGSS